jgi:putative ABC transport system substrate-binding protein
MIRRREFITLLGGAAAWPIAARGQQSKMPVVGYVTAGGFSRSTAPFRKGLAEMGFIEGRSISIVMRSAERYEQLPDMIAELINIPVAVICTAGSTNSVLAAKSATAKIPIVFVIGGDPVRLGLVDALNRPGGNVTGVTMFSALLASKRLERLRELVRSSEVIAFLVNPANSRAEADIRY